MRRKAKLIVTGMMLVCTSVVLAYSSAKPQPVRTFRTKKAPAPVQIGSRRLWSVQALREWVQAGAPPVDAGEGGGDG